MDDSLRNEDVLDAFSASLISRLSDLGADVRQYFKAAIELRTLPMAERDGGEINRLEESRGEIEKECNFYQTELGEYMNDFINSLLPSYVTQICTIQADYKETLYKLDIAPAAGQHMDDYPERSIDSYLTDYALETVNLINGFKGETLPKFQQDQINFVKDVLNVLVGNGQDYSLTTLLRRDEPMSTFETIASKFDAEIAGQIQSVTAIKEGMSAIQDRWNQINAAITQFKANPVPLDV